MEFLRPEYWSGSPFPSPGIKPRFPALQEDYLPAEPPGKPKLQTLGTYLRHALVPRNVWHSDAKQLLLTA